MYVLLDLYPSKSFFCPRCVEVYFWSPNSLIIIRIGARGDLNIEAGYWLSKHRKLNVLVMFDLNRKSKGVDICS